MAIRRWRKFVVRRSLVESGVKPTIQPIKVLWERIRTIRELLTVNCGRVQVVLDGKVLLI